MNGGNLLLILLVAAGSLLMLLMHRRGGHGAHAGGPTGGGGHAGHGCGHGGHGGRERVEADEDEPADVDALRRQREEPDAEIERLEAEREAARIG